MTIILDSVDQQYEAVIGLEVHVQLSTFTKAFCADSANFNSQPNQNISTVSLGLPGALPLCNEKIIQYATKLGLAVNSKINRYHFFDRKNYFYADLPKGYQITQDNQPICTGGQLKIRLDNGTEKEIILNRIHMEEDAGKSIHDMDEHYSLIDLNRAGVALLEVVTEPMISSGEEAAAYLTELRKLVRYLDICDGNMEEGSMRCDANVSIRLKGATTLGNRCEVKNLNSIKNVQKAIEHEIKRQIKLVTNGERIEQNTLNFDAATGQTSPLRSKEMANDYRYFPEPDLLPLVLSEDFIESIRNNMPVLPEALYQRFTTEMNLPENDALVLIADKKTAHYFVEICKHTSHFKMASNWVMGAIRSYLNDHQIGFDQFMIPANEIAAIVNQVEDKRISHHQAKEIFQQLLQNPLSKTADLVKNINLSGLEDQNESALWITQVLEKFPEKVKEYHQGKKGVLGLFMGELMKISKGKIDPKTANQSIIEKLESLK